jgi:iron complex transport system substrate-binding protein
MRNRKYIWIFGIGCAAAALMLILLRPAGLKLKAAAVPTRIISAAPQLSEILCGLGVQDRIIAVSSDTDYPAALAAKPKIGTFWELNLEAIIAAKPDLVVMENFEQQQAVARKLESMGYPVVTVKLDTIADLFDDIAALGKACGTVGEAEELAASLKTSLINISGKLSTSRKFSVLWVMQTDPLCVAGRDTFINEMITLAGGINAIGPTVHQYPQIGSEQVIAAAPEIIIHPAMGPQPIREQQKAVERFWSKFPTIPAVRNHRIFVIPADTVSRLTPRIDKGIELIGRYLHPYMFKDVNEPNDVRPKGKG